MVIRQRFSFQGIRDVLGGLLEQDLHAKRVDALCNATLGVMHSASLAVCTIGQSLAAARSLKLKHAVKQVDKRWPRKIGQVSKLGSPFEKDGPR
jgi:hypothetical protein